MMRLARFPHEPIAGYRPAFLKQFRPDTQFLDPRLPQLLGPDGEPDRYPAHMEPLGAQPTRP